VQLLSRPTNSHSPANFREFLEACSACHRYRPTYVLSTSGNNMAGFLVKNFEGCCGSTVLTGASCWPSSNCILAQKIGSVSMKLNHNRSLLVLDSDSGVFCHHSSSQFISGFSKLWSPGQIRPAKPFHPGAKHILPKM